ncbi:hypothetical protein DYBT9623_04422 [Dyadobacter sp. CECT 9623]|uniref:Uncharacterized protein n=1 Tax=Dyadobacter linearis TaxID=2823330 RepID=A0ABM8UVY9_9BACT|nr:hypothetical protein [Dyadobacter sp. CECT 9623]CAG5072882.1 hypothetical protein DYBT9623_04422 [Dyadobacter sp. CECT 9623]
METSYKKAFRFTDVARTFINDQEDQETKLVYALNSVVEQIDEQREAYSKKVTKLQRKYAAEDKFGCILRDDKGNYRYKKDQEEVLEEKLDELFNHEDSVEFEPEYVDVASLPEKLPSFLRKTFSGFVIEPSEPESPSQKLKSLLHKTT